MPLPVLNEMRAALFTRRNLQMKLSIGRHPMKSGWSRSGGTPKSIGVMFPPISLDECNAALSHATPMSWLFYLPAYMRRALELLTGSSGDSDLPNSVIFHLTLDRGSSGPSFYAEADLHLIGPH
jgi:hypothetical protein